MRCCQNLPSVSVSLLSVTKKVVRPVPTNISSEIDLSVSLLKHVQAIPTAIFHGSKNENF